MPNKETKKTPSTINNSDVKNPCQKMRRSELLSDVILKPTVTSATVVNTLNNITGNESLIDMVSAIEEKIVSYKEDQTKVEDLLYAQAIVLNTFVEYTMKKIASTQDLAEIPIWGNLALKAQNNCRNTLATINEMKKSKQLTYIHQQNNELNQQTINCLDVKSKEQDFLNSENELLTKEKA